MIKQTKTQYTPPQCEELYLQVESMMISDSLNPNYSNPFNEEKEF